MTPTKENVERLMEVLDYSCDCESDCRGEVCGILLGNVIGAAGIAWTEEQQEQQWLELVKLWHECGADKSLQQIIEEGGWDEGWHGVAKFRADRKTGVVEKCYEIEEKLKEVEYLKSPEARALFDFLCSIFLTE